MGFVGVKGAYKVIVSIFAKPYEMLMGGLIERFFTYEAAHFWGVCAILVGFTIGFLLLARLALRRLNNKDG